jgi:poly(A) polymerase
MSLYNLLRGIKEDFDKAGYELYIVGGAVRGMLQGQEPKDIDLATNALPEQVLQTLHEALRFSQIGFATVRVTGIGGYLNIDITTYRSKETYDLVSRTPKVEYGKSIDEDLARRDFTINAMAMELEADGQKGELIDPYGGKEDLTDKRLVIPGHDETILQDDPLRILRAARVISEEHFCASILLTRFAKRLASHILYISRERWLLEMDRILLGDYAEEAMKWLAQIGVLNYMLPEVLPTYDLKQPKEYHYKNVWKHTLAVISNCSKIKTVRWAALLHDLGKPRTCHVEDGVIHFYQHEEVSAYLAQCICTRFKMSNKDTKEIVALVRNHGRSNSYTHVWRDSAVYRLVTDMKDYLEHLFDLSRADITSQNPKRLKARLLELDSLVARANAVKEQRKIEPRLLPREKFIALLKYLGVRPGPEVARIKTCIEEAIADGEVSAEATIEELVAVLKDKNVKLSLKNTQIRP